MNSANYFALTSLRREVSEDNAHSDESDVYFFSF